MAMNPRDMDGFMSLLTTTDIKKKVNVGVLLLNYLADPSKSIECQDIGLFIDNIVPWLNSSNPKVVQNGLDALTYLADRMGHDFRPYISTIIQPTIDRLGDNKDTTREKAQLMLLKIMEKGSMSPQHLLDKLQPAFTHKNAKLREEALVLLTTTVNEHGADGMSLSGVTPNIVKLVSDPSEKVRETAMTTLAEMYRHVGERLRIDLQKKLNVPQPKMMLLLEKFDQLRNDGDLLPQARAADVGKDSDEPDRAITSAQARKSPGLALKKSQFGPAKSLPTQGQAGAVDEETFLMAFEDVPPVKLFSLKDLEEQMKTIKDTIGDDKKDWKLRADNLRKLRGIIVAGGMNYEIFMECLKNLQRPFDAACQDLRSQVVREACITLAFLSQHLKNKFASFGETILNTLFNLIQNSAKVVASAGAVALRFILQNTHSSRFIPIVTATLNHKSKDIRRATCEYLHAILQSWPYPILHKHASILQDAIAKGMADSDADARAYARKSFWAFKEHFPENAEALLNSLDTTYKRALMSSSNSGSVNSLNAVTRSNSTSFTPRRPATSTSGRVTPVGARSTSAIDLHAAQRAKIRAQYGMVNRQKASQLRYNKSPEISAAPSPERLARPRSRVSGVSQSQPSSRSGSPSSKTSYHTYRGVDLMSHQKIISDTGMKSMSNSRDTSPQRYGFSSKLNRLKNMHTTPDRPLSRPVMAQKILQQSREAESLLADAFTYDSLDNCMRTPKSKDDHSDDSETNSICSEISHDGHRRASDSFSWSGSQQRLYRDVWEQSPPKDIKEIIENLGRKWNDRKEGLLGLQHYLVRGYTLTATDLRKITDIFAKMFMDSHTKVFSLFLDTLNALLISHYEDLDEWLNVLCTRLLNKLGTDLLGSIQTKILKTLDIVREYFSGEQLLPAVMRFVTNPTQTPNSRVKIATLTFITQIAESRPSAFICDAAPLARLLDWTTDIKSHDVRRHAQAAIIALYNLNPSQVTMVLSQLPKNYQEAALPLVQNHLRRANSSSSHPVSPGTPPPRVPSSPARTRYHLDNDGADDSLSSEEVFKSLRRTTAEIQNYGFERLERPTTSKDSGISNMADVEERMEGLTLSNSGRSSSVSSPTTQRGKTVMNPTVNGSGDTIAGDLILPQENNGYKTHGSSPDSIRGPEVLDSMLMILQSPESQTPEKVAALQEFQMYVREGDALYIKQRFRRLLKILIESLEIDCKDLQIEVLQSLIDVLKCPELAECFSNFAELLVLKVIRAHKFDDQKTDSSSSGGSGNSSRTTVLRMAEKCAATVAVVLPSEQTIQFASSMMTTEPFPHNMGAIKMLHKVVEHWGRNAIEPHLSKVMPGLIKAYDDAESTVRKSAVFCMVAIHAAVGEEALSPFLSSLYGSKLKLLNIYIQRAQQNSQPASPRSNSHKN